MNESLVRPFMEEEIRATHFQMSLSKLPDLMVSMLDFFQKNWDIVGPKVCKAILFSLNNELLDHKLNSTFLALIPKTRNPTNVTKFRPVNLCNAFYKIISRCWLIVLK